MNHVLCLGVAVQDFVFGLDAIPAAADKFRAKSFASVGGGCAATAAVAVARLGGAVQLATRLGDDHLADIIVGELAAYGVDCTYARRFAGCQSSLSAVIIDDAGERLIVNYRDHHLPDTTDWLPEPLPEGIAAVLADSRWPTGAAAILDVARNAGVPAVLDAESPLSDCRDAVRIASHIAFSFGGLRDYAGEGDIAALVRSVAVETGVFVCATDGERGVYFSRSGKEDGHIASYPVVAVDTLGAGDVWHGAFALALAEGQDELDAIRFASATAALKCTHFGGRAGVPDRESVERLMAEAG